MECSDPHVLPGTAPPQFPQSIQLEHHIWELLMGQQCWQELHTHLPVTEGQQDRLPQPYSSRTSGLPCVTEVAAPR